MKWICVFILVDNAIAISYIGPNLPLCISVVYRLRSGLFGNGGCCRVQWRTIIHLTMLMLFVVGDLFISFCFVVEPCVSVEMMNRWTFYVFCLSTSCAF